MQPRCLFFALVAAVACRANGVVREDLQVSGGDNRLAVSTLAGASVVVDPALRYVGGQTIQLFGNAEAQQHIFAIADSTGMVRRFCWLQFEHFLPTNAMHYDYQVDRSVSLGDLRFMYDVKSWADYRVTTTDSGSDGQAMARLLARHGMRFPQRAVRVRMFYFPDSSRRAEIMVIYGEALDAASQIRTTPNGVALDASDPASAELIVSRAAATISFRSR